MRYKAGVGVPVVRARGALRLALPCPDLSAPPSFVAVDVVLPIRGTGRGGDSEGRLRPQTAKYRQSSAEYCVVVSPIGEAGRGGDSDGRFHHRRLQQLAQGSPPNVKQFRGGLVFKANKLVYHSTLGWRVIKKKKVRRPPSHQPSERDQTAFFLVLDLHWLSPESGGVFNNLRKVHPALGVGSNCLFQVLDAIRRLVLQITSIEKDELYPI